MKIVDLSFAVVYNKYEMKLIKKRGIDMMYEDIYVLDKLEGAYIGDLCYALEDKVYDGVWGAHDYEHDHYTTEDGLQFAMGSTAFGDGFYHGSDGSGFSVDAGIIGVADLRLVTKTPKEELKDLGVIIIYELLMETKGRD